jgi:mannose-1-phosphate guanylyltransferase
MEHAVIMAGGSGTRFWPLSTPQNPKQCLPLVSDKPLIVETIENLQDIFPKENIYIATSQHLKEKLSKLVDTKYIIEPCAKNTTGCIGLTCIHLLKKDPEAIIFIETADHFYKNREKYHQHVKEAISIAKEDKIVTIGIKPHFPATGFGYIAPAENYRTEGIQSFEVKEFKEKPNLETARDFVKQGHLWNSGMYIFKAQVMLDEIEKYQPKIYKHLMNIYNVLGTDREEEVTKEEFSKLDSVSIDYAISEKTTELIVVKADMHWDDIGSWLALERIKQKDSQNNIVQGKHYNIGSTDNIIYSDKPVATIGVKDFIIVNTPEVTMVVHKSQAEKIKELSKLVPKN